MQLCQSCITGDNNFDVQYFGFHVFLQTAAPLLFMLMFMPAVQDGRFNCSSIRREQITIAF